MNKRGRGRIRPIQYLGALVLALCSSAAMALGLGDIRVLSKPGQPFVAEIPVVSNDPAELENARVALASPATFARVGLERPTGLISDLQFQFTQDAQGRAVIRVTSSMPVDQKSISFLIEVDWGQGRLVREYSALIDAPNTAAAIAEPAIEAPQTAAGNTIVREPEPVPVAEQPSAETAVAANADSPTGTPAASAPVAPAPAASSPAATPAQQRVAPGESLAPVQKGQTLSEIALRLSRGSGYTLDQTMLALLRSNPDAFIGNNINRLKQGAVLRTPLQDELAKIGAAEARAMVREQATQWQQARAPIPQPADGGQSTAAQAPAAPAASGARLEIAPAVASDAKNAGSTSGLAAGGEGDMVANEQLQQAQEDVASRDAEIKELQSRIGELEKLQQQQQKLISMKDTELAAAQQQLAKNGAQQAGDGGGFPIWLLGGVVLILAGVVAWFAARRRKPSPLPPLPRREFEMPVAGSSVPYTTYQTEEAPDEFDESQDESEDRFELSQEQPMVDSEADDAPRAAEPTVTPEYVEQHVEAPVEQPVAPAPSPVPRPAGRDRLELAVAYLDLGDTETARGLLREVAAGGDPEARVEAAQLLEKIG